MGARQIHHKSDPASPSRRLVSARPWPCRCSPDAAIAWLDAVAEFALADANFDVAAISESAEHFLVGVARHNRERARVGDQ